MKLPVFQKILTQDYAINQLQNNVTQLFNTISIQPLVTGNLLKSVIIAAGVNTINHGLGAPITGYIITASNEFINTFNSDSNSPSTTFLLHSTGGAQVDIFVF